MRMSYFFISAWNFGRCIPVSSALRVTFQALRLSANACLPLPFSSGGNRTPPRAGKALNRRPSGAVETGRAAECTLAIPPTAIIEQHQTDPPAEGASGEGRVAAADDRTGGGAGSRWISRAAQGRDGGPACPSPDPAPRRKSLDFQ
jgi:hypothetical protein